MALDAINRGFTRVATTAKEHPIPFVAGAALLGVVVGLAYRGSRKLGALIGAVALGGAALITTFFTRRAAEKKAAEKPAEVMTSETRRAEAKAQNRPPPSTGLQFREDGSQVLEMLRSETEAWLYPSGRASLLEAPGTGPDAIREQQVKLAVACVLLDTLVATLKERTDAVSTELKAWAADWRAPLSKARMSAIPAEGGSLGYCLNNLRIPEAAHAKIVETLRAAGLPERECIELQAERAACRVISKRTASSEERTAALRELETAIGLARKLSPQGTTSIDVPPLFLRIADSLLLPEERQALTLLLKEPVVREFLSQDEGWKLDDAVLADLATVEGLAPYAVLWRASRYQEEQAKAFKRGTALEQRPGAKAGRMLGMIPQEDLFKGVSSRSLTERIPELSGNIRALSAVEARVEQLEKTPIHELPLQEQPWQGLQDRTRLVDALGKAFITPEMMDRLYPPDAEASFWKENSSFTDFLHMLSSVQQVEAGELPLPTHFRLVASRRDRAEAATEGRPPAPIRFYEKSDNVAPALRILYPSPIPKRTILDEVVAGGGSMDHQVNLTVASYYLESMHKTFRAIGGNKNDKAIAEEICAWVEAWGPILREAMAPGIPADGVPDFGALLALPMDEWRAPGLLRALESAGMAPGHIEKLRQAWMPPPTARSIIEEEIPARLTARPELVKEIGAVLHFDVSGEGGGQWTLDCTRDTDWVKPRLEGTAAMTVRVSSEDLVLIRSGELDPSAVMGSRLKLDPLDMRLADKLGDLFSER